MSVSMSVYIGPYLIIEPKIIHKTNTVYICENPTCEEHKLPNNLQSKFKFCHVCGGHVIVKNEEVKKKYTAWAKFDELGIVDVFAPVFMDEDYGANSNNLYIPNLTGNKSIGIYINGYSQPSEIIHFDDEFNKEKEIEKLKTLYSNALKKLQKDDWKITYDFGILVYYS